MAQLGKYELQEAIGRGGFGTVYRAVDRGLQRTVALKVLHPSLAADIEFAERFQREARLAASLEHPNIVAVYDTGEDQGRVYIVMRYYPGGSLAERLKRGTMPFEQARGILQQVCTGLQKLHERGWVHRDLKPANILFDVDGNAVVGDFGLARAQLASSTSSSLTIGAGTPFYRAPELWRGKPPASPASDVYSLGCILGEMLSGQVLFGGDTPEEVLTRHLMDGPDFGPGWPPEGTPAKAVALIGRALERAPTARPKDAGAFAAELYWKETETVVADGERAADDAASAGVSSRTSFSRAGRLPLDKPAGKRRGIIVGGAVLLGVLALAITGVISLVSGGGTMAPEPVSLPTAAPTKSPLPTQPPTRTPEPTATTAPTEVSTRIMEKDGMVQVFVPAGEFEMGSEGGGQNEQPVHRVYLEDYWIDQTEVTHAMYWRCVMERGCKQPFNVTFYNDSKYDQYPVIYVSWYDADAYCGWAGRRLPTEEEWEKAARGADGRTYPWGNQRPDCSLANGRSCGNELKPAGSLPAGASPYGALDMSGNVWEWVQDWYESDYYKTSPERNPTGPADGDYKVVRGGSWLNLALDLRSADRLYSRPDLRYNNIGFRCVVSAGK